MRMVCLISDIRAAASGSETRRESVTALDGETFVTCFNAYLYRCEGSDGA